MSRKELSPFAPDRWIRELNRLEPNLWQSLRKSYEEPQRSLHGYDDALKLFRSTPDWCVMPTMFPFFLLTRKYGEGYYLRHMEEMMSIATMYTWRISKGVYRFAPEIYEALVHQPLTGDLPCEFLHRLPEWAVYIESPGLSMEGHPLEGFIAHLDYNWFTRETDLQFAIFAKGEIQPRMVVLPLSGGTLLDAMRKLDAQDEAFIPGGRKGKVATQEE